MNIMIRHKKKSTLPLLALILYTFHANLFISHAFTTTTKNNHAKKSLFPPLSTLTSSSTTSTFATLSKGGGFGTTSSSDGKEDLKRKETIDSLEQWAKQVGILTKDIKVESGSKIIGGGLGLLTTNNIDKPNSLLLQIPTHLTFSTSTSDLEANTSSEQYFANNAKTYRASPWYEKLAIDLFICKSISSLRPNASNNNDEMVDMKPWLDSLPTSFSTPIHWTQEERQELQYTPLVSMINIQEKSYMKTYNNIMKGIEPQSDLDLQKFTYDDFLWGCDCAKSRAFSGSYNGAAFDPKPYVLTLLLVAAYVGAGLGSLEQASNGAALVLCGSVLKDFVLPKILLKNYKKYIICPFIDMANHIGMKEEGNVAFEYFGNGYSLASTTKLPKGKEVRISYGPRSNDILLQQYGFVEEDNAHDVYVMPPLREWDISALEVAVGRKFLPGRLDKLDRAGLLGGTSLSLDDDENDFEEGVANRGRGVVITRAGGIDPAIMAALRVLVSSEEEWQSAGEAVGNLVTENSGGKENERLARFAAQKALELELEGKETTLEEDEELMKKMVTWSDAEMLAVQFRIEKKKLLKETIFSLSLL